MTTSLKAAVAAFALFVSTIPATLAFASPSDGIYQSCEDHDFTPHGVWDCH
ncbi:MAG: hypothetical protein ABWZ19_02685 [Hyphomicrobium sp.]